MAEYCIFRQKIVFFLCKNSQNCDFRFYKFAFQAGYFALVLMSTLARLYKNPITHHFL